MSVTETVNRKLTKISGDLSEFLEDSEMSKEEKEAINEAERLADQYSDIKPDQMVISGKHLFQK